MSRFGATFLAILAFACYVEHVSGKKWESQWIEGIGSRQKFGSYGATSFSELEKNSNLYSIVFYKSNLPNIEGGIFYPFRNTLETLDIHESKVQTISSDAFYKLIHLKNLILWGNKLNTVWEAWFQDLQELRTLDLSFNNISYIEETAFLRIPKLENLYIDNNVLKELNPYVFTYLGKLTTIRFAKNRWNWRFHTQIMKQLDSQRVSYSRDWEDFKWISHVVWDCKLNEQAANEFDDRALDCASAHLLSVTSKILNNGQKYCPTEAENLYFCEKYHKEKNVTNTRQVTVRKVFQTFIGAVNKMLYPDAELTYRKAIDRGIPRDETIAVFGD